MIPALAPAAFFIHPGLLGLGAALVAVPIVIHLLNRRRVRHQRWAAMQWLLAAARRHQRRLRLENWLILALRIAAVLVLGLALARPVLTEPALAGLIGSKKSVYLVVDSSYSMGTARSGRTFEELAKSEAEAVLSSLGPEDTISVVVTNDPRTQSSDGTAPFVLVPRVVGRDGVARAKEAVASLSRRHAPADWPATLSLLARQTTDEDTNRLVVLVTDLQAKDWREASTQQLANLLRLPAAIRVVEVGGPERRNLTVARLTVPMRRDAFVGHPLRLAAVVENQGPTEVRQARVSVALDNSATTLATAKVDSLPAFDAETGKPGTETVVFDLPGSELKTPGSHVLTVEISPPPDDAGADALGLDSRRSLALGFRDRIRVLAWTEASRGARVTAETYLRGLFERYATNDQGQRVERNNLYDLRTVPSDEDLLEALRGRGETPDLVVLANEVPRRETATALEAFVRGGGALLVFVGDNARLSDPSALNDLFWADASRRLLPLPYGPPEVLDANEHDGYQLDFAKTTGNPLAAPFTDPKAEMWIGLYPLIVWGRMPFREPAPGASPDGGGPAAPNAPETVVLRYADGSPFAVEGAFGAGKTLWVSTCLDGEGRWTKNALPFFLPVLLDRAAKELTRPDDERRNLEVGRRMVVTWLPRDAQGVHVMPAGGSETTPTRYDAAGPLDRPTWVEDRVGTVGVWNLVYQAEGRRGQVREVVEHFAVNPDPSEGRLARASDASVLGALPAESDVRVLTTWGEATATTQSVEQGEISSILLWVLFGLLVVESLLSWLFGRSGEQRATAASPANG